MGVLFDNNPLLGEVTGKKGIDLSPRGQAASRAEQNASRVAGQADFSGTQSPYASQLARLHQQNIATRQAGRTPMARNTGAGRTKAASDTVATPATNAPRGRGSMASSFFDGPSIYSQPNPSGKRSLLGGA